MHFRLKTSFRRSRCQNLWNLVAAQTAHAVVILHWISYGCSFFRKMLITFTRKIVCYALWKWSFRYAHYCFFLFVCLGSIACSGYIRVKCFSSDTDCLFFHSFISCFCLIYKLKIIQVNHISWWLSRGYL